MNILFVNACLRGKPASNTLALCHTVLEDMAKANPKNKIETVDLLAQPLSPFTADMVQQRDALLNSKNYGHSSFNLAHQFAKADAIIIGAPYWDLSFPGVLKAYAEHICVCGITFTYANNRPVSLCQVKNLAYITTAGGYIGQYNFGSAYWQGLCQHFFGINKVDVLTAEGLDILGADTTAIMNEAKKKAVTLAGQLSAII